MASLFNLQGKSSEHVAELKEMLDCHLARLLPGLMAFRGKDPAVAIKAMETQEAIEFFRSLSWASAAPHGLQVIYSYKSKSHHH